MSDLMLEWIRSVASGSQGGNCVEVAFEEDGEGVLVRDSKNPTGWKLSFTNAEWDAFLDGVKKGEFDRVGRVK